ncbi:hypothetical protein Patl1_31968 [Pistacia atlantica]|uniref:Uncharacterized protein n=1 Tax=Pistacia atlantica TaxID=434234 RepID=A0ACC1APW6_9ROSI|nr:hypothetical protein Patl1_31968 [Pistacia atlantica]
MADRRIAPVTLTPDREIELHQSSRFSSHEKAESSHRQHVIDVNNGGNGATSACPFVLSFNNLSYSVRIRPKMLFAPIRKSEEESKEIRSKVLLNNISGEAREGEVVAVLGASGAGKSTLIDALAGRIERKSLKGSVTLNGEALESRLLKVISAYVMQDDLLYPMLTVEETLMYAAEFRLPRTVSKEKKKARVQALIDQLGLRRAMNTVIGDEAHRGVSGGERRRVSIGMDIIHDPILLFLDEPTSGLDSTSAFLVIKVLQGIARSGSIVMMSLHQPSYRILDLLDRLLLLSRGQTVFDGSPPNLSRFFKEFGNPVPENANQTEFALDVIRELENAPGGVTNLVEFNHSWQTMNRKKEVREMPNLSLKDAIKASISRGKLVSADTSTNDSNLTTIPDYSNPFCIEVIIISSRLLRNLSRLPGIFGMRLGTIFVTGLILASLYWQLDDSPKGSEERLAFLSFTLITIFFACSEEIPFFIEERFILIRETAYNAYRVISYVLAHTLLSIPSSITLALALSLTTFWAVGLSGGCSGFFFYFLVFLSSFWAGSSFTAFMSSMVSDITLSFTVSVSVLAYFLVFSGFYIPRDSIPAYWIWFHYLSMVKYPYQAIAQNEFSDSSSSKCFMKGVQLFDKTPFEDVPVATKVNLLEGMGTTLGTNFTTSSCLSTGMQILEQKGVTDISKWKNLWITFAWGFLFRILFYVVLSIRAKNKRK